VRAVLHRDGRLTVSVQPLTADTEKPVRLGLFPEPRRSTDPFCRHKTTIRGALDQARTTAEAQGFDDVCFLNEAGYVTESSWHTVFVRRGHILLKPPVAAGLLPGVLRGLLLDLGARRARPEAFTDADERAVRILVPDPLASELLENRLGVEEAELREQELGNGSLFVGNAVRGLRAVAHIGAVDPSAVATT